MNERDGTDNQGDHVNIQVKEYKNAKEFQKDAQKMLSAGWRMEGQTSGNAVSAGGTAAKLALTGGLGLITGMSKKTVTTVTWVNDAPAAVVGLAVLPEKPTFGQRMAHAEYLKAERKAKGGFWKGNGSTAADRAALPDNDPRSPNYRRTADSQAARTAAITPLSAQAAPPPPPPPPAPLLSPDGLYQWNGTSWIPVA
jgi:hypothetical protein